MSTTYWAQKELHIHDMVKGLSIEGSIKLLESTLGVIDIVTDDNTPDNERLHRIEFRLIIEDYLDFYRNRQDKIRRSLELGGEA
jgi:hypothetical protein